jgi:aryl-alcohol dehydrogenase-like predicted oxidoreductase
MHFGEALDDERLVGLLRPGDGIDTVLTADVYGQGEADRLVGRALSGLPREDYFLVGALGHDFYEGERDGPRGFPRFTDPGLRGPDEYSSYLRMATERSLERCGVDSFDLLLLHNPDHTGFTSPVVWEGLEALRAEGLTRLLGVAPGPANGFTLDLISCFERFGDSIDWAMIILNPMEPWPGELCLDAAERYEVDLILERMRPVADRHGLTTIQLAAQWDLAHAPVKVVAPTLIQEAGPDARPVEEKRAELAATPAEIVLSEEEVDEVRSVGDNTGCMALKGASPDHEGDARADRWPLDPELAAVAERWGISPESQLRQVAA